MPRRTSRARRGTVTYGLNFQAWCVFLLVMHHVPVERCADILESMSGTRPSDGWVHALAHRAARAVAAANKTIRALIIMARVICGDETPVRAGPGPKSRKKYLQVACTDLLTYYFLGDRDLASFKVVRCRVELGAQDAGESAFAGFDDGAGVMCDQPAQHGVGVRGVAQVPGAVELVQAGGGEAGGVADVVHGPPWKTRTT